MGHKLRLRYSLSALLFAFIPVGMLLGWIVNDLARFRREQFVARQLEQQQVVVLWSSQTSNAPAPPGLELALWQLLTCGASPRVDCVDFTHGHTSETELKLIDRCKDISYVRLSGTEICDSGMRYVACLRSLQRLEIRNTSVTATGLAMLEHANCLRALWVTEDMLGQDELEVISRLTQLKWLDIGRCKDNAKIAFLRKHLPDCLVIGSLYPEQGTEKTP